MDRFIYQDIDDFISLQREYKELKAKIFLRVGEIVHIICDECDAVLDWWESYEEMSLDECQGIGFVGLVIAGSRSELVAELGYSDGFPGSFLLLDDNEIRAIVSKEVKKYNKKKQRLLKKLESKEQTLENDKKKALDKLTTKDRKILGLDQ